MNFFRIPEVVEIYEGDVTSALQSAEADLRAVQGDVLILTADNGVGTHPEHPLEWSRYTSLYKREQKGWVKASSEEVFDWVQPRLAANPIPCTRDHVSRYGDPNAGEELEINLLASKLADLAPGLLADGYEGRLDQGLTTSHAESVIHEIFGGNYRSLWHKTDEGYATLDVATVYFCRSEDTGGAPLEPERIFPALMGLYPDELLGLRYVYLVAETGTYIFIPSSNELFNVEKLAI